MLMLFLKIAVAAAAAAFLYWQISRYAGEERHGRVVMLDPFRDQVTRPEVSIDALGYPVVNGELDGHPLRLSLFPDTLVMRTLPVLWLQALWTRPHSGRLRVTLEPAGTDYFNEPDDLRTRFASPEAWQRKAEPCGKNADSLSLLRSLERVDVDELPALKAVEISEQALKLTFRFARADRGTYRVLRSARFQGGPAPDDLVAQVLGGLRQIQDALEEGEAER
jgi:hypothetical protein